MHNNLKKNWEQEVLIRGITTVNERLGPSEEEVDSHGTRERGGSQE